VIVQSRKNIALLASVAAVVLGGVAAPAASAKPAWKFNGVTVTCEHLVLVMNISNVLEVGHAELTELWPFGCRPSNPNCVIESIEARKTPWPAHGALASFLLIEGVDIGMKFGGNLCALAGLVEVIGTAGGFFANSALEFNKATFEATGTALKVGVVKVEWSGVFLMEAFDAHREQTLELR
jgi:hypothetical protein